LFHSLSLKQVGIIKEILSILPQTSYSVPLAPENGFHYPLAHDPSVVPLRQCKDCLLEEDVYFIVVIVAAASVIDLIVEETKCPFPVVADELGLLSRYLYASEFESEENRTSALASVACPAFLGQSISENSSFMNFLRSLSPGEMNCLTRGPWLTPMMCTFNRDVRAPRYSGPLQVGVTNLLLFLLRDRIRVETVAFRVFQWFNQSQWPVRQSREYEWTRLSQEVKLDGDLPLEVMAIVMEWLALKDARNIDRVSKSWRRMHQTLLTLDVLNTVRKLVSGLPRHERGHIKSTQRASPHTLRRVPVSSTLLAIAAQKTVDVLYQAGEAEVLVNQAESLSDQAFALLGLDNSAATPPSSPHLNSRVLITPQVDAELCLALSVLSNENKVDGKILVHSQTKLQSAQALLSGHLQFAETLSEPSPATKRVSEALTRLHLHLALVEISLKRFPDAVEKCQTCLDFDPGNIAALIIMGYGCLGTKELDTARSAFETAEKFLYSEAKETSDSQSLQGNWKEVLAQGKMRLRDAIESFVDTRNQLTTNLAISLRNRPSRRML
jgi:hypothetical protein